MEITPKQYRNMYAIFIGLFAVSTAFTVFNITQEHKKRKLELKDREAQEAFRKKMLSEHQHTHKG